MTILEVYESRMSFWRRRVEVLQNFNGARFGSGIQVEAALVASSRARQGQGRPKHAEQELTDSSYVVRKASSCSLRSTNPSDIGHVRLAVRRGTGHNWKNHSFRKLGCCTFPKCSEGPRSAHQLVHVSRFRGRQRSSIAGKHQRDAFLQRGPDVRDECRDDARLPTLACRLSWSRT